MPGDRARAPAAGRLLRRAGSRLWAAERLVARRDFGFSAVQGHLAVRTTGAAEVLRCFHGAGVVKRASEGPRGGLRDVLPRSKAFSAGRLAFGGRSRTRAASTASFPRPRAARCSVAGPPGLGAAVFS